MNEEQEETRYLLLTTLVALAPPNGPERERYEQQRAECAQKLSVTGKHYPFVDGFTRMLQQSAEYTRITRRPAFLHQIGQPWTKSTYVFAGATFTRLHDARSHMADLLGEARASYIEEHLIDGGGE